MKKIIQKEISETYCDVTNQKLGTEYSGLNFCLVRFDKKLKDWEEFYLDLDLSNEVASEIFHFLKGKYPKAIKKIVDLKRYSKFEGMPEQ